MLFIQPVVVSDAQAMDLATPAEVRKAERQVGQLGMEQPNWSGWADTLLAQSGMDSRSPFGPNAVDHNDLTPPASAPHQPTDAVEPPSTPNAKPADSSSNTRIPPAEAAPGQTDAGPPGTPNSTATPGIAPSTETPATAPSTETPKAGPSSETMPMGTETPRSLSMPNEPGGPGPVTTSGTGLSPGKSSPPTPANPYEPSSSTYPGAREASLPGSSSGASNTE